MKPIYVCCECGCDLKDYDSFYDFNGDLYCEKCVEKCRRWTDTLDDTDDGYDRRYDV